MSPSQKIHDGPPARYQLQMKRVNLDKESDEEFKLRKFTLGECDPRYVNRTILLVGETGSGKSTLINALVNFVMGVEFEDKVWFEVISDEKDRPQSKSQTSAVSVYEIFGFEGKTVPYSLTIIDTPGYGDTEGLDKDEMIIQLLQSLFCIPQGVDTVSAVGLVMKASVNRLDDRVAYVFNSVTSLFGKDMKKNIVVMITHSDGREPTNALKALEAADIKVAKNSKNEPVYFLFNNFNIEEIYKEKVKRSWWNKKAVTCNNCEENCHRSCTWAMSPSWCEVMKDGKCTSCSGKCPVDAHVKENKKYVTKTRRVTSEGKKAKYEQNKTKSEEKTSLLQDLEKEEVELKQKKSKYLNKAFDIIVRLESIALNEDSVSTYIHLEFLIEKMKETGDKEKVKKLEKMRHRMDEKNKSGAKYLCLKKRKH
uniref:AAA+ ATPase domain-containing protein n=1 Tax=Periophthalmus magnuspinnatus TaxID=409849 RepID=A0A3B4B9A7_9GOBI